jgi:outer membrane protein TolC
VTETNFQEGISSLSDLLNASSSLVQAQMNYVNTLGESMKAYIDLKEAVGTIHDLKQ